jgi:hypothetical protein
MESELQARLIRPIVLVLTWLSLKLTVTVWPKQVGFVTAHAAVFFTAIGATFFMFSGTVTCARACARAVALSAGRKMPLTGFSATTSTQECGAHGDVPGNVTVGAAMPLKFCCA